MYAVLRLFLIFVSLGVQVDGTASGAGSCHTGPNVSPWNNIARGLLVKIIGSFFQFWNRSIAISTPRRILGALQMQE